MVSIAEVYAHLSIECPSGFLQAEVVVQLLVRKVPALEREVVASATETVGKAQVVGDGSEPRSRPCSNRFWKNNR